MSTRSRRFLMAVWDGAGNAPPQLAVGRRLVERGHEVHVLGDPSNAAGAEAAGCSFSPWTRGTARTELDASDTEGHDWATEEPLDVVRRIRDHLQSGPASEFAADTAAAIEVFKPDIVAPDSQLFGAIIAAEEARLPVAALVPNLWMVPTPGTGDPVSLKLVNRVMKAGLPDLNAARAERGLPPVADFYDQLLNVDRILMLTSETFDDASPFLPSNVHYVGPVLDDPVWVEPWASPWPESNQDPLVLVGFSNLFQNQGPLLQRVIDVLASMRVRAVVTLGRTLSIRRLGGDGQRPRCSLRPAQPAAAGRIPGDHPLRARDDHQGARRRRAHGLRPDGTRSGRHRRVRGQAGSGHCGAAQRGLRRTVR